MKTAVPVPPWSRLTATNEVQWLRIVAPHFTAGIKFRGEACVDSAPILSYARRMNRGAFLAYCRSKGWQIEELPKIQDERKTTDEHRSSHAGSTGNQRD